MVPRRQALRWARFRRELAGCRQVGRVTVNVLERADGAVGNTAQCVLLPPEVAVDERALREGGVGAGNDFPDGVAPHDVPQRNRRGVRRAVVHPSAHRRIERQPDHLDEHLTWLRCLGGLLVNGEVTSVEGPDRT